MKPGPVPKPKHRRNCQFCGRIFWVKAWVLKKSNVGRFCSQRCAGFGRINTQQRGGPTHWWWNPNPSEKIKKRRKRNAEQPEVEKAHYIAKKLLKHNKIKNAPCQVCGASTGLHKHHPDYSKPEKVVWLCYKHHAQLHKKTKKEVSECSNVFTNQEPCAHLAEWNGTIGTTTFICTTLKCGEDYHG